MKNRKTLLAVLAGLALSSCTTRVTTENVRGEKRCVSKFGRSENI